MATSRVVENGPLYLRKTEFLGLASLFAVDPLVDCGGPEAPELAHLDTCDLTSKHHALKGAGMDAEQGCCGVTIQ
jgi:hypothetical protein